MDHVVPLKRGGADAVENMQWQSEADAEAKDRVESAARRGTFVVDPSMRPTIARSSTRKDARGETQAVGGRGSDRALGVAEAISTLRRDP